MSYEGNEIEVKTVTVIIPTYNRWPVICSAIDSVLVQTYGPTDCLVVDDASTDGTADLIKDRYGGKVSVVVHKTNRGQSICKNTGADVCNSDCICFLDSDDVFSDDAVEKRVSLINKNPGDVSVSFGLMRASSNRQHHLLHKKKRGDKLLLAEYLREKSWCNNNGFLISRQKFLAEGLYDERLRNKEDIELLLRLLCKYPFYYCGAEIGKVRDVCGENRARNNYTQIVQQGSLFSSIVLNNPLLKNVVSQSDIRAFICSDIEEELRGLYKLGRFCEFRILYKKARRDGHILETKRFFKRFILSYAKEIYKTISRSVG